MDNDFIMSTLAKTWILDLDGTIVKHNGYLIDGHDTLLDNSKAFLEKIPSEDMIVIVTARSEKYKKLTEDFLKTNSIRYDYIIFNAPTGERIIVNDKKPSGLVTAYAVI